MIASSRIFIASLAAVAAVGVCGAETLATPPGDDTTPDLEQAAQQSSAAPYRLEMFMEASMMGMNIDGSTPLAVGEFAGDQSHMTMDFGAIFAGIIPADQMPAELRGVDLVMEFVTDGTDFYMRAPFLAALSELGSNDPSAAVFSELGDGWGYVDGTAVPGVDPGALTASMGVGGADPAALFALLADAEGTESIGTTDIRGVNATGIRAEVNLGELMEAQGTPVPATGNPFGDATFPIEVWIDKDGFVRRLVMDMDGEAIGAAAEASGEDVPTAMFADMNMSITMEMFDYDAPDIVIDVPTEFTDITAEFAEIMPNAGG